jgi:thioredoxin
MNHCTPQAKNPLHLVRTKFILLLSIIGIAACLLLSGCAATKSSLDLTELTAQRPSIEQVSFHAEQESLPPIVTLGANDQLNAVLKQAPGNVLIDFYADWCGPCRKQGKLLHDLESTIADSNSTVIKVNIDHHPSLAKRFNIEGLPTIVVMKNRQYVNRLVGFSNRSRIETVLRD